MAEESTGRLAYPVTDSQYMDMVRQIWPEVAARGDLTRLSIEVSAGEFAKVVVERMLTVAELQVVRKYVELWDVRCVDRTRARAWPEGGFEADSNEAAVPARSAAPDPVTSSSRPTER